MAPERIEREIVIAAPPERVWAIVTEPRHIGSWFSDTAEVDLRAGGELRLTWGSGTAVHGVVERVEPPRLFSFRWAMPAGARPAPGNTTLVEFHLSPEGEGTRLRVVESGFHLLDMPEADRDRRAQQNTGGWALELGELEQYAAGLAV
jgi:uncharacterized protein YndB with AHSA1/START domain